MLALTKSLNKSVNGFFSGMHNASKWTDGSKVLFQNFANLYSSTGCPVLRNDGSWLIKACNETRAVLCKRGNDYMEEWHRRCRVQYKSKNARFLSIFKTILRLSRKVVQPLKRYLLLWPGYIHPNSPCQLPCGEETGVSSEKPAITVKSSFTLFTSRVLEPTISECKGTCYDHYATETTITYLCNLELR